MPGAALRRRRVASGAGQDFVPPPLPHGLDWTRRRARWSLDGPGRRRGAKTGSPAGGAVVVDLMDAQDLPMGSEGEEPLVLRLEDLLPDGAGEVVFSAADSTSVELLADSPLTGAGFADNHVTAAGVDVTGLSYCSFESGLTLYYPSEIPLIVSPDLV